MNSGELALESPPFLHVTWSIPDFFRLATESKYFLQSPDFTFTDGRYCIRLFPKTEFSYGKLQIELMNLTDSDPGRSLLYGDLLKLSTKDIEMNRDTSDKKTFCFYRSTLEHPGVQYVPDGTLTVLCSVRLREPGRAESLKSGGARTQVIPEYRMIGKLSSESLQFLYVTWRIPEFFQLPQESRYILESPQFPFSGRRYCLRLLSNGDRKRYIDIELVNLTDTVSGISYEVGLKSTSGEEIHIDDRYSTSFTRQFRIFRNKLDYIKSECFPDGHLTLFCCMRARQPSSAGRPKSGGAETPGSKALVPQAAATPKSVGVQISNEEEDTGELPGISKLLSDLRLQKGEENDACLVVGGKEFRAHKTILRARSKVFDAMFSHDKAERESGRVVIDDLDPDSFGHFLEYLYTGGVGAGLSDDNAFGLYKAADKYDVATLKAECVAHMRRNLSVDSFCNVLVVALRHPEEELLSQVVLFFKENMTRIIVTAKWKQLVAENGASANELLIKTFMPPRQ